MSRKKTKKKATITGIKADWTQGEPMPWFVIAIETPTEEVITNAFSRNPETEKIEEYPGQITVNKYSLSISTSFTHIVVEISKEEGGRRFIAWTPETGVKKSDAIYGMLSAIAHPEHPEKPIRTEEGWLVYSFHTSISRLIAPYCLTQEDADQIEPCFYLDKKRDLDLGIAPKERKRKDKIDPKACDYFGELLKGILQEAGYKVVLDIPPIPIVPTTKVTIHSERMKWGRTAQEQLELWPKGDYTQNGLIGLALDTGEELALYGIQTLLDRTDYKGNVQGRELEDPSNPFKFVGYLPWLKTTIPEYLNACGVKKVKSARGKLEYDRAEREIALTGLEKAATKKHPMGYERKYWIETKTGKKEERSDIIMTEASLVRLVKGYTGLTRDEVDRLKRSGKETHEKLYTLWIEVSPPLVDQIDNYFLLKPSNMLTEIRDYCKEKKQRTSKYYARFIGWLILQASHRKQASQPYIAEIGEKLLMTRLRMDGYMRKRQWARIKKILSACYQVALGLGYITKHEEKPGVRDTIKSFTLNPEKCLSMRLLDMDAKNDKQSHVVTEV